MPLIGFGVYKITDPKECEQSVLDAISLGYRSLDAAASYMNEVPVGNAIKKSGVVRGELFIAAKLWVKDAGCKSTKKALQNSRDRLELDYLDLDLINVAVNDFTYSYCLFTGKLKTEKDYESR